MKKITFAYMCFLLLLYPFYTEGNYFNIVEAKWKVLFAVTIIFLLEWLAACLWQRGLRKQRYDRLFLFLGVFAAALVISGVLSSRVTAWTGIAGRYTGSIFLLLMVAVVFAAAIALGQTERKKLLVLFGIGGMFMALWSILNFVGIDVFGTHKGLVRGLVRNYVGGIGNIVFLGNYFCMVFAIGSVLAITAHNRRQRGFWGMVVISSALGIFLSGSDSAVLCAGALLFAFACVGGSAEDRAEGFIFMFMCVIGAGIAAGLLQKVTIYENGAFDEVMTRLLKHNAFIMTGLCMLVLSGLAKKEGKMRLLVRDLIVAGVAGIVFMAFSQGNGMVFDEYWGNGRGYAWINGGKIFLQEPLLQKIFGNGGDCFKGLLIEYTGSNVGVNAQSFDNAHCEYLEYLLCYGILGLGAYLALIGVILKRCLKGGGAYGLAVASGMCGYLLQSAMGLNQVMTTPVFFGLCALGCVEGEEKEEAEDVKNAEKGQRLYE